jgi:hypothetical protein
VTTLLALLAMTFLGRCVQVLVLGTSLRDARWGFGERAAVWAVATFVPSSFCLELLARTGTFGPANTLRSTVALCLVAAVAVVSSGRSVLLVPRLPRLGVRGIWLLCVLGVAAVIGSRGSFDHLAGGRDPGTYHLMGALLGKQGALHMTDPVLRNIPIETRETFFYWRHGEPQKSPGFYVGPDGVTIEPRFFPLVPAWSATLAPLLGSERASRLLPLLWSLGALAVIYLAMARWWSPRGALIGACLLLVCAPQIYFSRTLTSEMLRQWLLFSAMLLLGLAPDRRHLATLAGLAMGLIPLAHMGSLMIALPVAVCALYQQLVGRGRRELTFYVAFFSLWLWGCLHARLAFSPKLPIVGLSVPFRPLDLGLAALVVLMLVGGRLSRLRGAVGSPGKVRIGAAGLLVALALHAYFLRPHLPARNLEAAWDRINLPMLGWYLSPLLLALALAGATLWLLGRAKRQDAHPLFFSVAISLTFIFVARKFIHGDHIWTMRRFLPEVIPCLIGFCVIALEALLASGKVRMAIASASAMLVLGFEAWVAVPVINLEEYKGSSTYARELASLLGPLDIMVMEQSLPTVLAAGAVDLIHGRNAVVFRETSREQADHLGRLCGEWIAQGRKVLVVTPYARGPRLSDELAFKLHRTIRLALPYLERTMDRAPRAIQSLDATLRIYAVVPWMASGFPMPGEGFVDVGYDDFGLVDGCYEPEIALGTLDTYRWTTRSATVLVPFYAPMEEAVLTIRGAAPRPGLETAPQVLVEVSLNGRNLGQAVVKPSLTELSLIAPGDALAIGYNEVRVEVKEGLGSQTLPTGERKELGLWIDWVRLQPKAAWKTSGK